MLQSRLIVLSIQCLLYGSIICSLNSCINIVNTRKSALSRDPDFQQGDTFIMDKVKGVTHNFSASLYDWTKQRGSKVLKQPIDYLPFKEFELLAQGLDKKTLELEVLPEETKQLIHKVTGATYLIRIDVLGRYTSDRYTNIYNLEESESVGKATLMFHVIHLLNDSYSYSFRLKTTVTHVNIFNMQDYNIYKSQRAANIAFRKGWRQILRGVD